MVGRRTVWLPTWRATLVAVVLVCALTVLAVSAAYPFLAPTRPAPGARTAIVEGWLSDEAAAVVTERLRSGSYERIITTGGPVSKGSPLAAYRTFAELGAERLRLSGVAPARIAPVPAPYVQRDRTGESARAVAEYLATHEVDDRFDLISFGPHARRSWQIFQHELAPRTVGVIAAPPDDYDPESWWTTSEGARSVVGEAIAYAAWLVLD